MTPHNGSCLPSGISNLADMYLQRRHNRGMQVVSLQGSHDHWHVNFDDSQPGGTECEACEM